MEVSLGAAGWARLKHPCSGFISIAGADLVCKHLGYPMAIGTGNSCKINEQDDELPDVKTSHDCYLSYYSTLLEYLQSTVLRCENPVDRYDPESQRNREWETESPSDSAWELACAYGRSVHN